MKQVIKYVVVDLVRNKTLVVYTLVLLALSLGVFMMETNENKGVLSLLTIVLFVVPLMSVIFSTIYLYNSAEFLELLLSQPLKRSTIWSSLFLGLTLCLVSSVVLGVGLPVLLLARTSAGWLLLLSACVLTMIFISLAFWAAVRLRDKAKGVGLSILLWLYFAIIFNALILFFVFQFSDYPIENAMIAISLLNPIDICRIFVLLDTDFSAMMGYTGAIFRKFFGTEKGMFIAALVMAAWIVTPYMFSLRYFLKKDI